MDHLTQTNPSYSDKELAQFRNLVTAKIDEVKANLKSFDDTPAPGQHPGDLHHAGIAYIKELESALVRIENKTFGICRATGKLIAKDQLTEKPHLTVCSC